MALKMAYSCRFQFREKSRFTRFSAKKSFIASFYTFHRFQQKSSNQCDQIGQLLKDLDFIFSYKLAQIFSNFLEQFETRYFLSKNYPVVFWAILEHGWKSLILIVGRQSVDFAHCRQPANGPSNAALSSVGILTRSISN